MSGNLKQYENMDTATISPRQHSICYSMKPIAINSIHVESLTSYITRLAEQHCITVGTFIRQFVEPKLHTKYSRNLFQKPTAINNCEKNALTMTKILYSLTGSSDLDKLTLLPFKDFFPSHVLSGARYWCPVCLEELWEDGKTIYEKFIWSFECVDFCMKHNCKLVNECPKCNSVNKVLSPDSRVGHCVICRAWLGNKKGEKISDDEAEWGRWVDENLRTFFTVSSNDRFQLVKKEEIYKRFDRINNIEIREFGLSKLGFARLTKIYATNLIHWEQNRHLPSLRNLLKVAYCFDMRLIELLSNEFDDFLFKIMRKLPKCALENKGGHKQGKRIDHATLEKKLNEIIKANEYPPPSLSKVKRRLGYADGNGNVNDRFPEHCKIIKERYRTYTKNNHKTTLKIKKELIKQKVKECNDKGIYPTYRIIGEDIGDAFFAKNNQLMQAYIDIIDELGIKRIVRNMDE